VLKALSGDSATGPLYQVDTRLRPHGASGPLTTTLESFRRYLGESAHSWERLAMTRARVIYATGGFGRQVSDAIRSLLSRPVDPEGLAREVLTMRRKLEGSRGPKDLKRGSGGLTDLEFIAQFLMLAHASRSSELLRTNLWDAFDALRAAGVLPAPVHQELVAAYDFLRTVEGRLRLIYNRPGADLPESPEDRLSLARRLNYGSTDAGEAVELFLRDAQRHALAARSAFESLVRG
jgi:glutamate-ammonia-ligase adenylyltransferase